MANRGAMPPVLLTVLLGAAALLAAAVARPHPALALTLETPLTNSDGSNNFTDPDVPLSRLSGRNLSGQSGDSDGQPHTLTFGSPDNGGTTFSFTVGPTQRTSNPFGFDNDRFFRAGPPNNNR